MTVANLHLLENHKTKATAYINVAMSQFKVSLSGRAEANFWLYPFSEVFIVAVQA